MIAAIIRASVKARYLVLLAAFALVDRAVENLTSKLIEEFIVVALVCGLFLWHVRSALVAILTLPLGILMVSR